MYNTIIWKFNPDGTTEAISNPSNKEILASLDSIIKKMDKDSLRKLMIKAMESYISNNVTDGFILNYFRNFEGSGL